MYSPVFYTGIMARKKTLHNGKRVEILIPHKILDMLDKEAESLHTCRSETLRRILTEHFEMDSSKSIPPTPENETIDVILCRLDNIDEKLNSINARVKTFGKRAKR